MKVAKKTRRTPAPLKRRRHVAEPARRFYIFSEGVKTEPEYFGAIEREYKHTRIEVEGVGGVARTVAEQAIEQANALRRGERRRSHTSSYEEQDQVWAVFDRDNHPQFETAVAMCAARRVNIARSNPCFEVWLVLHFETYDRPTNSNGIQARLHELLPEYHHQQSPSPDFGALIEQVEAAEHRAATQLTAREAEQRPFGNPSTTVGHLTRAIREAHQLTQPKHQDQV